MDTSHIQLDKPFLSYNDQIDKLCKKGLIIDDRDRAINLLKTYSYFDLVSGYKQLFKASSGQYKPHTTIDDLHTLYEFDNSLRAVMFKRILIVEKHIKSLLSYSFCETFGENQQLYLDATKYNYIPCNQNGINKLISELKKIIDYPNPYPYILHQKRKYGNIPLWAIVKALTMGKISAMYSYLQPSIQSKISHEFAFVNEDDLTRMI